MLALSNKIKKLTIFLNTPFAIGQQANDKVVFKEIYIYAFSRYFYSKRLTKEEHKLFVTEPTVFIVYTVN